MKRGIKFIVLWIVLLVIGLAGVFYYQNLRGAWPAIQSPPDDITNVIPPAAPILPPSSQSSSTPPVVVPPPTNATNMPLSLPPGFSISLLAKDLSGARVMARDQFGNFWVSRPNAGVVTLVSLQNGVVKHQGDVLKNLNKPHGLAFDPKFPGSLFIAEADKIIRIATYSDQEKPDKIIDLPSGGHHDLHTIKFGPDDRLYVKLGSTCNVCTESDERSAKIFSMNRDGSDFKEFARGLRNSPFFTWSYVDGRMWATEMGRDLLGDDTPPDEINVIKQGGNYGWPNCYGKNIHDTDFDKNTYVRNPCMEPFETPSFIDIPAHSAPLGLAFVPEEGWPEKYWYNLFVAYHGSWNRSTPTGYKVVRVKLDSKGNFLGTEDFITGWITPKGALGRPVDILTEPGGVMFISDDKAGVIYKVTTSAGQQ
ncbi:MAG: PQQ-dependent sugar dehydrogenase [Patescibacteria group bacterium]